MEVYLNCPGKLIDLPVYLEEVQHFEYSVDPTEFNEDSIVNKKWRAVGRVYLPNGTEIFVQKYALTRTQLFEDGCWEEVGRPGLFGRIWRRLSWIVSYGS